MDVGVELVFQNVHESMSDEVMFRNECKVAELCEELGFDSVWPVEHHFREYAMCPDNTQFLSWLAGRTNRIKLGTGAVILPWNEPLRVAEKLVVLDHLSDGRALFGMGRGLSRREYAGFGIDMSEARERFDESAKMILAALENGYIEGDGRYYKQPRIDIRPRPSRSFKGRTYGVAVSAESVGSVADLGARLMFFAQYEAEKHKPAVDEYRRLYRERHQTAPGPIVNVGFMYCDDDPGRAQENARRYITRYFHELVYHYDMMGAHFAGTSGYKSYAQAAEMLRAAGMEAAGEAFVNAQDWGTPNRILERIERRRAVLGDMEVSVVTSYGGMPYADVERSMRLFSEKVMPELRSWDASRGYSESHREAVAQA